MMQGFELSPQQRRLWRAQNGRAMLTAQCAWRVEGPLDAERLGQALRRVAGRHESPRLKFVHVRGIKLPLQVTGDAAALSWRAIDLRGLSPAQQADQVDLLLRDEREREFDLEHGSPLRVALASLAEGQELLVFTLPSLCADSRTLRLLLEETLRVYDGAALPPADDDELIQYIQYAGWQNELIESEEAEQGKLYWQQQAGGPALACRSNAHPSRNRGLCRPRSRLISLATWPSVSTRQPETTIRLPRCCCWHAGWRYCGACRNSPR